MNHLPAMAWRRGVVTMVVVVVVVVAPKWNEQRKNEPGVLGTRKKGGKQGRGRIQTDGFHLPVRRGRREDQRKTVVAAAVDPCSVSKPHGKNEREGGHRGEGTFKPWTPLTRQTPTQASKTGQSQRLLTVRARGCRTGRTDGQGRVQTGFMDQHATTGGTDDGSDQFPRAQKTPLHRKRPHHTKKDRMKIIGV